MANKLLRQGNSVLISSTDQATGSTVVERDASADASFRRATSTDQTITGGLVVGYATKTSNYVATSADQVIVADNTSGAVTITLPVAASSTGQVLEIKRYDATPSTTLTSYTTVDGDGSETIDGVASLFLTLHGESVKLICDGSNWKILDRHIPQNSTTKAASFNAASAATIYLCTAASDITATLGAAAAWIGKTLYFKKVDSGSGDVILDGNASETIDGSATSSTTIDTQYEVRAIYSDGSNWHVLNASSPG